MESKFAPKLNRHSGQAGDSYRDPESRNFKDIWMPVVAGMTAYGSRFIQSTLALAHRFPFELETRKSRRETVFPY